MATFASLGFNVDTQINEILTQFLRKDPSSPLAEAVNREFTKILDNNANAAVHAKAGTIKLSEKLNVEEQIVLSNCIPEFNLVFTNKIEKPHAFASAMRKVKYHILLERIAYRPEKVAFLDGRSCYAVDVGGDFSFHVRNGNVGIHSDCPVTDERDDARYKSRVERLRREFESDLVEKVFATGKEDKSEYVNDFLSRLSKYGACEDVFCNKLSQNCSKTARYLLFVQSNYDISLRTFADIMVKKQSVEAYGSFIFSTDILLNERGTIPMLNAMYVVDKDADSIEFTFRGCQSFAYRHKLSVYLSYVTTHVFYDSTLNHRFLLELLENRCGVQFFKVTPISEQTPISTVSHNLWFPSLVNKSVVTFYEPDYEALGGRDGEPTMRRCNFVVDNKLIDKLKAQATSQTENKFKPVELYCFIQAYCGRMFIGSDVVMRHEPLSAAASKALAHAVYIEVYREKYDAGKVLQKILRDVDSDRAAVNSTSWQKFLRCLGTPCYVFGSAVELARYTARPRPVLPCIAAVRKFLWRSVRSEFGLAPFIVSCNEFQRNASRVGSMRLKVKFVYDDLWFRFSRKQQVKLVKLFNKGFVVPVSEAVPLSFDVARLVRDSIKGNYGLNADTEEVTGDGDRVEYSEALSS
uniref:Alphavirus-like MT domain-containing protein n=1 Tax=Globodera rostochiensis TaxID=31243 RepID=A0A914GS71_GLORO